ncbi:MAG: zinc-ribbon domain-containing protein [Gemmatimonadaceae bacterium]
MNVGCPQCSSIFRVDPAKVPPGGVRARCSICSGVIPVPEPSAERIAAGPQPPAPPSLARTTGQYSMKTPAAGVPRTVTPPPMRAQQPPAFEDPVPAAPVMPAAPAAISAASAASAAPAEAAPVVASGIPGPTMSINPYLARDPDVRAKRLARALISDIVTYYPNKHADALRAGSLKQTFSEEIKKSYEEYVAQIGQEFAESTTHFKDALNEVLGEGKQLF